MRETSLADNLLIKHKYETFKALLNELGASWTATELAHGTNALTLRNCRVTYERSMVIMMREERASQNPEAEWQRILECCREFGFQPK
jgi:hypothetical protein